MACHLPPVGVALDRLFNSVAMAKAQRLSTSNRIGPPRDACLVEAAESVLPLALAAARPAFLRSELIRRSFSARACCRAAGS